MISPIPILSFCGSLRNDSWNRKALTIAESIAREKGASVETLSLGAENFPLYNADLHTNGFPPALFAAREKMRNARIVLIASPEYNYSVTGVLKNAIDWFSLSPDNVMDGKYAVLLGVSNGPFKTVRGQFHLRQILTAVNVLVLPQPQVLLTIDDFNADGTLSEPLRHRLEILIEKTLALAEKK
jgi:chromate reductase